jgi:hypothetical protein
MKNIKIEMKWAIIFVVMGFIWMALERAAGLHDEHISKHAIYTNLVAIPAITIYVLALLDKRRNYYHGVMTYAQGVITGVIITAIVTVLTPLTQYITSEFIAPTYFPNAIRYSVEKGGMTEEAARNYFSMKSYIVQATFGAAVMGVITTVIVAFFTKKNGRTSHAQSGTVSR